MLGFLATIALSAVSVIAVFDAAPDPFPQWVVMLAALFSALGVFVALALTSAELDTVRRAHRWARERLQEWETSAATLQSRDASLGKRAEQLARREASLLQRQAALAGREEEAHKLALINAEAREGIRADRDGLTKLDSMLGQRRQELEESAQAQAALMRQLDAIAFERRLLPWRGAFFETRQEALVAQTYDAMDIRATVRPKLGVVDDGDDVQFFLPLLGLPELGALHVHLCGPQLFRDAYRSKAWAFAEHAGISAIVSDEDSVDIPADIERQLGGLPHNPNSPANYQKALRSGS